MKHQFSFHDTQNNVLLFAGISATLLNVAFSYTKLGSFTYFIPFTFLMLFMFQKNKIQELKQLFSIEGWKRPLIHITIMITFTYFYIHKTSVIQLSSLQLLFLIYWLLIQAFNEEYIFRYLFLTKLHGDMRKKVLLSSILFTAAHYVLPENLTTLSAFFWATLCFRFFIGILLSLYYLNHHSIYEITILHCLTNLFNFLQINGINEYAALLCFLLLVEKRSWFLNQIKAIKKSA